MNIIKLNAISSTNEYLKALNNSQNLPNFTTVTANYQTNGKGQRGAKWNSEAGKNLICSILVKNVIDKPEHLFILNVAVSLAIVQTLKQLTNLQFNIKWPNDILSENKKIGGILIENSLHYNNKITSIVGIGLNINQQNFENLPKATSLYNLSRFEYDIEMVLKALLNHLKVKIHKFIEENENVLWEEYHSYLYKLNVPAVFASDNKENFMGIIKGVNPHGKLLLQHHDNLIYEYDIKDITMLY